MSGKYDHNTEIIIKIKQTMYEYSDKISVAEAVGLLEIAKLELLEEQKVVLDAKEG